VCIGDAGVRYYCDYCAITPATRPEAPHAHRGETRRSRLRPQRRRRRGRGPRWRFGSIRAACGKG